MVEGVSDSPAIELALAVLPPVLFLLLMVMLDGMLLCPKADPGRGDARGGVLTGAGNLDRADCTRCSSRCICAVRLRMCVRDVELGRPRVAGALFLALRITAGVAFLLRVVLGGAGGGAIAGPLEVEDLKFPDGILEVGFGVVLESAVGTFILLLGFMGVLTDSLAVADASEIGGDGGVGAVVFVETDLLSTGVIIIGDEEVDAGDPSSNLGVFGAVRSIDNEASWRFRNLSCIISASTFRSDSSSRKRWVSMRSCSRSCSPILISSSIMTALSMDTLYFDSKSSRDEEVFRACLSKSSFETSISRSFS